MWVQEATLRGCADAPVRGSQAAVALHIEGPLAPKWPQAAAPWQAAAATAAVEAYARPALTAEPALGAAMTALQAWPPLGGVSTASSAQSVPMMPLAPCATTVAGTPVMGSRCGGPQPVIHVMHYHQANGAIATGADACYTSAAAGYEASRVAAGSQQPAAASPDPAGGRRTPLRVRQYGPGDPPRRPPPRG